MSIHFRDLVDAAGQDGVITAEEILALRREGWADGAIRLHEADAIFVLNDRIVEPTREWSDFFVEAIGEFIISASEPRGYVSEEQADWLMTRICHDGKTDSLTELELLVRLFERAQSVPQRLRHYALEQVERAVMTGEGPTRCGGALEKGRVSEAEARLMRRIIFASGSERPAAVSRTEAESLYRIKDATLEADNSPEWKQLFVQGVGNYLMGLQSQTVLSSERAAELERFMSDRSGSIGGFLARMGRSAATGDVADALRTMFVRKQKRPDREDAGTQASRIDSGEQRWLQNQINGNDRLDELDQALFDFIQEEQQRWSR